MTMLNEQRVFVVDDDDAVRDSIAELLASVGRRSECHASAASFLASYRPERPGCLVLDVRMPGMGGLALQQKLAAMGGRIPIILLTGHGDVPMAVQAMKAGAVDFLQKPYRDQALLDSIEAALSLDAAARCADRTGDQPSRCRDSLTQREREVLEHLLLGRTSKEIARSLGISPRTAEVHRRNLLGKCGAGSVKELLRLSGVAKPER